MIDRTTDFEDPDIDTVVKHGETVPPMAQWWVVSGTLLKSAYLGFGLDLNTVIQAELTSYPTPKEIAEEHSSSPWDLAVFDKMGRVAAVIMGRLGGPPEVWRPGTDNAD